MDLRKVKDKTFKPFIGKDEILLRVREISKQINSDLHGEDLLFIGVLNGSFMFVADLFRHIDLEAPERTETNN